MVWLLANWKLVISLGGIMVLGAWGALEHHWRVGLENQIAAAKLKAAEDALQASKDAQAKSDELILRQSAIFAENARTTNTVTREIVNVPVAYDCSKSRAVSLGLDGAARLLDGARLRGTTQTLGLVDATLQSAGSAVTRSK